MKDDELLELNRFRDVCLTNASDAIASAEILLQHKKNHLAFHLAVLSLEELAKIFIAWQGRSREQTGQESEWSIPIDDHNKKIFWAVWFPSLQFEGISIERWNKAKQFAASLHGRRLDLMYTAMSDTVRASLKVSEEEVSELISFSHQTLEILNSEGPFTGKEAPGEDIKWISDALDNPNTASFIMSPSAQQKLIELGNPHPWIEWLREQLAIEQQRLRDMAQKELDAPAPEESVAATPKWKMKFTVVTPSHWVRSKGLKLYNKENKFIKLARGADEHTLQVEMTFGKGIHLNELWLHGWLFARMFVVSLNISANGFFFGTFPKTPENIMTACGILRIMYV